MAQVPDDAIHAGLRVELGAGRVGVTLVFADRGQPFASRISRLLFASFAGASLRWKRITAPAGGFWPSVRDGPPPSSPPPPPGRRSGEREPEHVQRLGRTLGLQLVQRRQVVNHPQTAALGGGDEIVVFQRQIGDGYDGQVELERFQFAPSSKLTYMPASVPQ